MKLKYAISLLIIFAFLISACSPQTQQPVCNKPYILVGNDCCLDKDDNSICDKDEIKEEPKAEEPKQITQEKVVEETQEKVTYDIGDVQANINKITGVYFDEVVFKRSSKSTEDLDFYTDDKKTTVFLVRSSVGGKDFLKVLEKFSITLINIKSEGKYLNNREDFFNFVKDQLPLLISHLDIRKNAIIDDFKNGEMRDYVKTKTKTDSSLKLAFVNYSLSKNIIYDNITLFDTVSDKIIETTKLSFENYDLWYNNSNGNLRNIDPIGVEYLQAYSIYCSPNLIITMYANGYKELRGYEGSFDENSFKNLVVNERKILLNEAQALISLCEQRYDEQFSYLRWR